MHVFSSEYFIVLYVLFFFPLWCMNHSDQISSHSGIISSGRLKHKIGILHRACITNTSWTFSIDAYLIADRKGLFSRKVKQAVLRTVIQECLKLINGNSEMKYEKLFQRSYRYSFV